MVVVAVIDILVVAVVVVILVVAVVADAVNHGCCSDCYSGYCRLLLL